MRPSVVWVVVAMYAITITLTAAQQEHSAGVRTEGSNCGFRDSLPRLVFDGELGAVGRVLSEGLRERGWETVVASESKKVLVFHTQERENLLGFETDDIVDRYLLVTLHEEEGARIRMAIFVAEQSERKDRGTSFAALEPRWFIQGFDELVRDTKRKLLNEAKEN